jgi:hypothetical protein
MDPDIYEVLDLELIGLDELREIESYLGHYDRDDD